MIVSTISISKTNNVNTEDNLNGLSDDEAKSISILTTYSQVEKAIRPDLLEALTYMYGAERFLHKESIDLRNQQAGLTDEQLKLMPKREVHIRHVTYSFAELHDWYQNIKWKLLNVSGVIGTDIDEVKNNITVIVSTAANTNLSSIREIFKSYSIPENAYTFEMSDPIKPSATVMDKITPIKGGPQIYWKDFVSNNWRYHICSAGFIATVNGQKGIVTAAHCTENVGILDDEQFYQGGWQTTFLGSNTIESSRMGKNRFRSDSAFIPIPSNVSSSTSVVKTQSLNTRNLNIKTGRARAWTNLFNFGAPAIGDRAYKTGRATGTSSGIIDRVCVNTAFWHSGSYISLPCQMRVDGDVYNNCQASGDSGSAVLGSVNGVDSWNHTYNYSRSATLLGIHHSGGRTHGYFSPLSAIIEDLGQISNFR